MGCRSDQALSRRLARLAAPALRRAGGAPMDHERQGRGPHPRIADLAAERRAGLLDRREFLRLAALLGLFAPLGPGRPRAEDAAAAVPGADAPLTGGRLRVAMPIRPVVDPAAFDWVEMSNLVRHQLEHLTITGADNITRPMLASGWAASDDLKTWTFSLREGVLWHSGAAFDAADVAANLARWLDPATGSSNLGLFAALAGEGAGVEVVDPLTLRLHLAWPVLAMPENFFNYPTAILHRGYEPGALAAIDGTGPYRLVASRPGEAARLERMERDGWRYWGAAAAHVGPGHVDGIDYVHVPAGGVEAVELLVAGAVDLAPDLGLEAIEAARAAAGAQLFSTDTAQTGCMRMRVDTPPFDDIRVRRALQYCADPAAYPPALFEGLGRAAEHHHVAPLHPDYARNPSPVRDIGRARVLLAEAGLPYGLDVTLDVGNTSGVWQQRAAELLRDQAAEAGIRIAVNVIPAADYQARWKETPFGFTQWQHRPLGTMALALGYRSGVPWNETGFADPAFDAALSTAESVLDVFARREAMAPVQAMLQSAAVMVQPVWSPVFALASDRVRGFTLQPTQYHLFNGVWLAG